MFAPKVDDHRKKPANEAFTISTSPVKTSSAPARISSKNKAKEIKRDEPSRTQDRFKNTLRELEQKTYPFPDSDMAAMLDDLLEKKVIELPECKRPEEMNRVNDPKYCKYHRIVSHPVSKCFILKELIMKLAQQGRIELDLEDTAATHTTTIVFGSFEPVPLQRIHDHSRQCSSHMAPSARPLLGANNQDAPTDDEEGWTLVTYKKTGKPRPQATKPRLEQAKKPKVEQGRKHRRRNNRKPKGSVRAAKPMYSGELMEQEPRIPVSLHEYFPEDFFRQCTTAACHMVEVEIEGPSKGKVIATEEGETITLEEGLPTHYSVEEALRFPKKMRRALTSVIATPDDHKVQESKAKNANTQHISVSAEQDQEDPKPAPRRSVFNKMNHSRPRNSALNRIGGQSRTSVFRRLSTPTAQSSVFERLSKPKGESDTIGSPPRRSAMERLEDSKKSSRRRKTMPNEEKLGSLAEKDDVRSLIPSRMKRHTTLEIDTKGPLKVRRRTIVHTGQSSPQQAQEDDTANEVKDVSPITIQENKKDEIPEEDVTFGSFNSKSSPRPLGAYSKSSEVEGWTHVTPKKLHENHTTSPQVHQSERGQSSFCKPPKQRESVEDEEISTQRSFMRDLFFLEHLFKYSVKASCYEECEERFSKIATKKLDKQQPSRLQVYQSKRTKTAFVNLQSNVKVLEIVKFRHKDHPSPSQCATSSPKTSLSTRSRLLAMKIARNASPKPLDKSITTKAPRSHEPKRRHQSSSFARA